MLCLVWTPVPSPSFFYNTHQLKKPTIYSTISGQRLPADCYKLARWTLRFSLDCAFCLFLSLPSLSFFVVAVVVVAWFRNKLLPSSRAFWGEKTLNPFYIPPRATGLPLCCQSSTGWRLTPLPLLRFSYVVCVVSPMYTRYCYRLSVSDPVWIPTIWRYS